MLVAALHLGGGLGSTSTFTANTARMPAGTPAQPSGTEARGIPEQLEQGDMPHVWDQGMDQRVDLMRFPFVTSKFAMSNPNLFHISMYLNRKKKSTNQFS